MAYCELADLKLGQLRLPDFMDKQKYTQDASEEIDIALGQRWKTPVSIDDDNPAQRQIKLLLKMVNANIATGRIIMAATIGNEDTQLNAYGKSLLTSGYDALVKIVEGSYQYPGLEDLDGAGNESSSAMVVLNQDSRSGVDAFYDVVAPNGVFASQPPLFPWGRAVAGG